MLADHGDLVDAHLLPAMERLLDAADRGPDEVREALNHLVSVHTDTLPRP